MSLYEVGPNKKITEYSQRDMQSEEEIECFLHEHPEVIEKDIMIVGRQVRTSDGGIIDLLGMDRDGNVVVIEVKKGMALRKVVSQILDYALWANNVNYNELNEAYKRLENTNGASHPDLHTALKARFGNAPEPLNPGQRLYIVSEDIDRRLSDMCQYLGRNGIRISCVKISFFEDDAGNRQVAHTEVVAGSQEGDEVDDWWDYNMRHYETEISDVINEAMSIMRAEPNCREKGSPAAGTRTFYTETDGRTTILATIYTYKTKYRGDLHFKAEPGHDFQDDRVMPHNYQFGDVGRNVEIVPENRDVVIKCAEYVCEVARKKGTNSTL